jgi:hypothetical protein
LLKFDSNLVCAPCHHGKMIVASHSLVNTVMTVQHGQLLHMDTISPSRVCSMGGKCYVLVIVFDYSRYSIWTLSVPLGFFLESKDEVFEHFWSLALTVTPYRHYRSLSGFFWRAKMKCLSTFGAWP